MDYYPKSGVTLACQYSQLFLKHVGPSNPPGIVWKPTHGKIKSLAKRSIPVIFNNHYNHNGSYNPNHNYIDH